MSISSISFLQVIHWRCKSELVGDDGYVLWTYRWPCDWICLIILNFWPFAEGVIWTSFIQSFLQWSHYINFFVISTGYNLDKFCPVVFAVKSYYNIVKILYKMTLYVMRNESICTKYGGTIDPLRRPKRAERWLIPDLLTFSKMLEFWSQKVEFGDTKSWSGRTRIKT